MPQKLSVGERQRVAIARSLANDPIVLLADEPTGNLDSVSAEGVFELFAELHREQGMTIVLITHDEEFGQRAERTIRMQDGHVKSDVFSESSPHPHAPAAVRGVKRPLSQRERVRVKGRPGQGGANAMRTGIFTSFGI